MKEASGPISVTKELQQQLNDNWRQVPKYPAHPRKLPRPRMGRLQLLLETQWCSAGAGTWQSLKARDLIVSKFGSQESFQRGLQPGALTPGDKLILLQIRLSLFVWEPVDEQAPILSVA